MLQRLAEDIKIVQAITITAGAAGASDVNGSVIDMTGYSGCLFVVQFGAIVGGAATSIKVQQDTALAFNVDPQDLTGTSQTVADDADNTVFYIDVREPREDFIRLVVSRATQNATCAAMAYLYRGRSHPATHGAGVSGELHYAPAEGTA